MEAQASQIAGNWIAQLGIFGFILAVLIGAVFLWLRESRAVRGDTETAIARKQRDLERKDTEIERLHGLLGKKDERIHELEARNRDLYEQLMACLYPGSRVVVQPAEEGDQ